MNWRPVFVFLLILNLGVLVWWAWPARPAPTVTPVRQIPALEIVRTGATAKAPVAARAAPDGTAARCVHLGVFTDASVAQKALDTLRATGAQADAIRRSRSPRGFNVQIPPLPSTQAATDLQAKLVTAGFTDQFLIREGAQANGIALGRFSTESAARTLQRKLAAAGFAADILPAGPVTSELWLQVAPSNGATPQTLRALAGARQARVEDCQG